ncbi:hypothetical protein SDC9_98939 [bioreactor metagenome]|uniref:Uncharacterized protein n=1 Tax=bioreactor metagenome TaxID=1076179 RepID=A0A645AMW4_9ZZZZ
MQGRALAARRAAAQMGQNGGQDDHGRHAQRHGLVFPYRHQNKIGARIRLHSPGAVEKYDYHAEQRQEKQQPGVTRPQLRGILDTQMKFHPGGAHNQSCGARQQEPFKKRAGMVQVRLQTKVQAYQHPLTRNEQEMCGS